MLEPQRMDRVLIVGTKDVMEPTINALHDMHLLHLEDYVEEGEYFKIGKPLTQATPLSEKLLKLRSIKSYLGTKVAAPSREKREKVLKDVDRYLVDLETSVSKKTAERSALESELKELNRREEALKPFVALALQPEMLSGYESVSVFIGTVPGDVEPAVRAVTPDYEYFSAPFARGRVVAAFVPKAAAAGVADALLKAGFAEIEPTKEAGEPAAIVKAIEDRKASIRGRLDFIEKELANLNEEFAHFIVSSEELLSVDTQKAEAPLRFATSDNTFVVDGWVPTPDFQRLRAGLAEATGGRVYVAQIEPEHAKYDTEAASPGHASHHEVNAPVKYNNPKFMEPVQALIDMYSRPKYSETDPTAIFFFLFPAFYGFILGDIGYGILLFLLGAGLTYMFRRSPAMTSLTKTLLICAVFAILFGIIFGEFMGFALAGEREVDGRMEYDVLFDVYPHDVRIGPIGPFSLPLERTRAGGPAEFGHGEHHYESYVFGIKDLLVFTCLVGVFHLALGYVIGFKNELKMHGLKTAILHKVSWLLVLFGGLAVIWFVFPLLIGGGLGNADFTSPLMVAGSAMAVVGLILLLMGEGFMGILELPALMSNVLSYTRLLAVGLSGVYIAFALQIMVGMLIALGPVGWVFGTIVFLMGHTINLMLGIIAPGLHALRLHYVEFFRKFYSGGGRIYSPYGYIRKYTED